MRPLGLAPPPCQVPVEPPPWGQAPHRTGLFSSHRPPLLSVQCAFWLVCSAQGEAGGKHPPQCGSSRGQRAAPRLVRPCAVSASPPHSARLWAVPGDACAPVLTGRPRGCGGARPVRWQPGPRGTGGGSSSDGAGEPWRRLCTPSSCREPACGPSVRLDLCSREGAGREAAGALWLRRPAGPSSRLTLPVSASSTLSLCPALGPVPCP